MGLDILLGLQWGDEGKGKIVDLLAPRYDIVARFQGGPNAGHTLNVKGRQFVFHTLPSGMIHKNVINVIGDGMVVDPVTLKKEIDDLKKDELFNPDQLLISKNAHLILPTHRELDAAQEKKKAADKIGSTLKGIGPCYTDKVSRKGLRIRDILDSGFEGKYSSLKEDHQKTLNYLNHEYDLSEKEEEWWDSLKLLKSLKIQDTQLFLNKELEKGVNILAEGAQGTLLDVDFGTYPYVTSSNTVAANACLGLGLPPKNVNKIYGIFKAYTTRVGEGPFPTELEGKEGELLKEKGNEYGATTGRPRRCGWLDLKGVDYAATINGVTHLIITKADILSEIEEVKICTGFENSDSYLDVLNNSEEFTPIYKTFNSWKENLELIESFTEIPANLKDYLSFIQRATGRPITLVSTGPQRKAYIEATEKEKV